MISKAAQGKGLLTHEKQKEAMAQFATFEAGDEGIVEGELWSVSFDSMFKKIAEESGVGPDSFWGLMSLMNLMKCLMKEHFLAWI
jgi:hypothetical protein